MSLDGISLRDPEESTNKFDVPPTGRLVEVRVSKGMIQT